MKHLRTRALSPFAALTSLLALVGALLTQGADARADVRLGVHAGGMLYVPATTPLSSRNAAGLLRAEAHFSLIPWLYLGAYGHLASTFGDAPTTAAAGAMFSVRPTIPFSPIHPFVYVSGGYAGFPLGPGQAAHWLEVSAGTGLTAMLSQHVGFEVRVAASKMFFGPPGDAEGPFALTGTAGLTFHF